RRVQEASVNRSSILVLLALGLACEACRGTAEAPKPMPKPEPIADATRHTFQQVTPSADYPLTTCAVSGEGLSGAHRVAYSYDGREVQFCCPHCAGAFKKDPTKYLAMLPAPTK